jgi:hypothetical protein
MSRLAAARQEQHEAKARFSMLVSEPNGPMFIDRRDRVRQATHDLDVALLQYMKAMRELTDFILHDIVPGDIVPPE